MENKQNWISFFIYSKLSFEEVIIKLVKPLVSELINDEFIDKYFFIRYWKEGPHVRLRLLPKLNIFKDSIIDIVNLRVDSFFAGDDKLDSLYSLRINDYIQEIQRFGGENAMEIAEDVFNSSSKIVLKILGNDYQDWNYSSAISYAIQMHILFAKSFIRDIDKTRLFFESIYRNWIPYSIKLEEGEKISQVEINKVNSFFVNSYKNQKQVIDFLVPNIWFEEDCTFWMKEWIEDCDDIYKLINESYSNNLFVSPNGFILNESTGLSEKDQKLMCVYDSFIHLTNNRLGVYLRDESFIAFLIINGLKSVNIDVKQAN